MDKYNYVVIFSVKKGLQIENEEISKGKKHYFSWASKSYKLILTGTCYNGKIEGFKRK